MSATPPETESEYSRGHRGFRGDSDRRSRGLAAAFSSPVGLRTGLVLASSLGAVLLIVAEFTTLFTVHVSTTLPPIRSVGTGSHHSYAIALIAVCALAMSTAVWRSGSRAALLCLGILGVAALLIALVHDLPDASAHGIVLTASHYIESSSTPSAGLYMETLGAVVLLIACVSGLLLLTPPAAARRSAPASGGPDEARRPRQSGI